VKLVDLNVLLYAVNRDSAHHEVIRRWWEDAINGDEPVGLAWIVLLGFLRLSTHPRVFPSPLDADEATDRVDAWLSHPNVKIVRETDEQWRLLKSQLDQTGTAGNLTTDAHLASLAIAHGATLVSCDTDFGRFAKLRWENPLSD
jgi:toxin-antitoxin system PIN domain toxin